MQHIKNSLNFSLFLFYAYFWPNSHTKSVKTLGYQRNQWTRRCIVPPTTRAITILMYPMVNAAHLFFIVWRIYYYRTSIYVSPHFLCLKILFVGTWTHTTRDNLHRTIHSTCSSRPAQSYSVICALGLLQFVFWWLSNVHLFFKDV